MGSPTAEMKSTNTTPTSPYCTLSVRGYQRAGFPYRQHHDHSDPQRRSLTPHLGLVIQNNREKIPKPNIWPIRRSEMKLHILRRLQRKPTRERRERSAWLIVNRTCHIKKSLSRFTPLDRTKISRGGEPPRFVIMYLSISSSVILYTQS